MNENSNTTPVAGSQSRSLSRRLFLGGAAAMVAPTAALALPIAEQAFDLREWLKTADPVEVARYHADALAETMAKLHPALKWQSVIDHEYHFALVSGLKNGRGTC